MDALPGLLVVGVASIAVILKIFTARKLWDMDGRTCDPLRYREHL